MDSIKSLSQVTATDAAQVGAKALNCARLLQAGFPVPEGFVVLAHAANVPALTAELEQALQPLPDGTMLAVRSSAIGEDGARQSFAGIHLTKLNVACGDVAEAVRACRESVRSPEALAYRQAQGLLADDLATGVLIQHMIQPVASGVAFTLDPVTGATGEIVINSSWGLGEVIAGGYVDCDEFRIRKSDATVVSKKIGDKAHCVAAENGESEIVRVEEDLRHISSLSDEGLRELTALVLRIERLFGSPQDVEWCFDGTRFWIVQSRPITAAAGGRSNEIEWTRANVREIMPDLPSPFALALSCRVLNGTFRDYYGALLAPEVELGPMVKPFFGRLYFNLTQFRRLCLVSGTPVGRMLRSLGHEGEIKPEEETAQHPPLGLALRALPDLLRLSRMVLTLPRRFRRQLSETQRLTREFDHLEPDALSDAELLKVLRSLEEPGAQQIKIVLLLGSVTAFELRLRSICERVGFSYERLVYSYLSAGAKSVSSRQAFDLVRLARQARGEPRVRAYFAGAAAGFPDYRRQLEGTDFLQRFDEFLNEYGHRGNYESDPALPRYVEDPEPLLWAVRMHVLAPECPDPESTIAAQEQQAKETWEAFRAAVKPLLRPLLLPVAASLLRRIKQAYLWREQFRSEMMRLFLALRRRVHLPLAERLVRRGWLDQAQDYFIVAWEEIGGALAYPSRAGELRKTVARNRAELLTWRNIEMPGVMRESELPGLIRRAAAAVPCTDTNMFSGLCVSPGQAEGEVVILREPTEFPLMKRGAILVAPATDPSWTPLFTLASGVVVELGGTLSHASTVAREFGLPAIANVRNATRLLRHGDRVRLDATNGVVYLLERPAPPPEQASVRTAGNPEVGIRHNSNG